MLNTILFLTSVTTTMAAYAGSSSDNNQFAFAGSSNYPNVQGFPIPAFARFDFNFLADYFDSLQKYHQQLAANGNAYSYSISSNAPNSKAVARSSITYDVIGIQQQAQQAGSGYGYPGGYTFTGNGNSYGGAYGGSYGSGGYGKGSPADGLAIASASIGPTGGLQKAAVYPENPNVPNIDARFGGGGSGQSYGVFTSSQSGSSDINGKPYKYNSATTTINDNGKVSTYTVHNP